METVLSHGPPLDFSLLRVGERFRFRRGSGLLYTKTSTYVPSTFETALQTQLFNIRSEQGVDYTVWGLVLVESVPVRKSAVPPAPRRAKHHTRGMKARSSFGGRWPD